jgi:hypothetical protein
MSEGRAVSRPARVETDSPEVTSAFKLEFEQIERDSSKEDLLSLSSNSILNLLVSSGVGQDESADLHYMHA